MLLISTNSSASLPSTARLEKRNPCNKTLQEIRPRLMGKRNLVRCDAWVRADFGEPLQHEPRAVFGNIKTQLDVCALHLHFRGLGAKEQIGISHLEQTLRFVPNPRRQVAGSVW